MGRDFVFTSESVTEGHPDKLCDQISDAVVDSFLRHDPYAFIRAECAVFNAVVFMGIRFASDASVDFSLVARKVIEGISYDPAEFNAATCSILATPQELIRPGERIFDEENLKPSDIGKVTVQNPVTVFGYACRQSSTLLPLPIWLAHKLTRQMDRARHEGTLPGLHPEGRVQVSVEYKDRKPERIHALTLLASFADGTDDHNELRERLQESVLNPVFASEDIRPDKKTALNINPEDVVLMGGPTRHSGLTGRKNAMDTYGEYARNSEKALSGKDPLRIDRIGAYAARYAAKNLVAAGLALECEVQLTYAIGKPGPASIGVETFGTGEIPDDELASLLADKFDFRVAAILSSFRLRRLPGEHHKGFYRKLAVYGHVGRDDLDLPWEATDLKEELKKW